MTDADDAYDEPVFQRVIGYAAAADRDVVDMVSGHPDWEPPTALREGLRTYADGDPPEFQYPPSEGLRGLREEIAARRNVERSRVVVTNGAGEANYLAMARAIERDVGSEFLLTDPVYPYYPGKAELLDADATRVPVREDGHVDVDAMRAAASDETAAVVLNTPNNPTGAVYDRESVAALADVASEVDALLVVDEVYDHFDFSGEFESALTLDRDNVVVTTAFSKSMGITGLRVGYAVFPEHLIEGALTRHTLVNVATSRPAQAAVANALKETPPSYYESVRDTLRERIDSFTDALDDAGAAYTTPEGAFYVLARFEDFPGTMANVERLIDEAGVAGMPGEVFGDAYGEWIRFSLCTDRADEAADRLAAYFEGR
ncbi:pyridoxal phosphate-dependent aminotransferase [Halobellus limi]|uniref:Aspartate/methionine/tyrosine aminotransferase n=1 Tax=Halobellus limi TaxID=699433 RepID=A0A1H6C2H2_9EURY|nr:pyridoxal phosphate-dependent aminotransferase [Halobellus limi]QCC48539.1 pyridoxal phosphate-dependent aminotransferase [Halobellus limi]SEG66845.1 Aspartate/methionine/tyrosine aminotransferase [Halobellus limi]